MKVITIGRNPENDVVIKDSFVSRHHCQIIQDDNGNFRLADFGSSNKTFVNGQEIKGEVKINPNDIIRIGNSTLPWESYFFNANQVVQATQTEIAETTLSPQINFTAKQRHGFITFCLWLGIIGNILGIVSAIYSYVMFESQISPFRYQDGFAQIVNPVNSLSSSLLTLVIIAFIGAIVGIVLISFILKWRKVGFYGQLVSSVVFGSINLYVINKMGNAIQDMGAYIDTTQQMIITIVGILFGTFIMWAVLQIKKNGVRCWDLLE
jgi:hypothetical protein